ncbi:MAG: hypothetical protein Q9166_005377 [cf. Caloplaca sp. 2 TL-2023]
MDYLPIPIDADAHANVAFFVPATTCYNPEQFFSLPSEEGQGDILDLVEKGLSNTTDTKSACAFLQKWLFFCFLAQVLGCSVKTADFYKSSDHSLHPRTLKEMLKKWCKDEKQLATSDPPKYKEQYWRTSIAIDYARRFVSKHLSLERMDRQHGTDTALLKEVLQPPHTDIPSTLTLSLAILGEIVQRERPPFQFPQTDRDSFWNPQNTEETSWGYSLYTREMLLKNKWCPTQVRRIEATSHGNIVVYYRCHMKPPQPSGKHEKCNAEACAAEPATGPPFREVHMQCQTPSKPRTCNIPEEKLCSIIRAGGIPMVIHRYGEVQPEVQSYDLQRDGHLTPTFGAISHAWSQGIVDCGRDSRGGNDRHMLLCQVESAQRTMNKLFQHLQAAGKREENIPFWIDVLCMPRSPDVRGAAINQLKCIFSKAAGIVIWDANLLKEKKILNIIELNMRIRASEYSRRMWTMLEAILAKEIYVQLNDATVSLGEIITARDEARREREHGQYYVWQAGHPFSSAIYQLRLYSQQHKTTTNPIQLAWEAVQFRTLSQPEDETIILACILGLDVAAIEAIGTLPGQQRMGTKDLAVRRMVRFLDLLTKIPGLGVPPGIIFLPGPRLRDPNIPETKEFGWAPRSWCSKQDHSYPIFRPLTPESYIMKDGLLVKFPGLLLSCPSNPVKHSMFWTCVQQSMHKWYKITTDMEDKEWQAFYEAEIFAKKDTRPSIILSEDSTRGKWQVGLLVRDKDDGTLAGNIRWVEVLCRLWVRLETNVNVIKGQVDSFHRNDGCMMFADRLEQDQKWCIAGGYEDQRAR